MGKLKSLTSSDISWIAGLLEGEGTFGVSNSNSPFLAVQMNDKDVLEQAQELMSANLYGPYTSRKGARIYIPHYRVALYGVPAISWMMTVYNLMGKRRRKRIRSIVEWWKERPYLCKGKPKVVIPYDRATGVLDDGHVEKL